MSKLLITLDVADVTTQNVIDALHEVERRLTSYTPDHDEMNGCITYDLSDKINAQKLYNDLQEAIREKNSVVIQGSLDLGLILRALYNEYHIEVKEEY